MKKWLFVLAALTAIILLGQLLQEQKLEITSKHGEVDHNKKIELVAIEADQVHRGKLLLINAQSQLSAEGIAEDIVEFARDQAAGAGFALENDTIMLSDEVLQALQKMLAAARQDGLEGFMLTSGYRSMEQQAMLYEQQGSDYALPAGYSEHNSGLAVDISSIAMKMEVAPEGAWLRDHAADYGFILRYPPNKQHITGIQYEPWHFRYVGLPHSLIMQEHGWVLEEYLQYLAENPNLSVGTKDGHFTIDYYSYSSDLLIKLPSDASYTISGDNVGGVIVTSWVEGEL
ncbi:D-Ala-D-Ala carboxypeptidase VanY [Paenibacillus montaniterrae]|uniref:D-Ala-D-Ala carboxypeptidase VanY n=1 Tax=Paenibacillus montaniterrae TaxID=429341 RepID=A0A919YSX9_9BACL|nr:M15 family metallopeptidase [Paenibacillus montaniterrae]GIP16308.1 D-Ala-D-Ala carboxypeptidase VanY [Paenibacillus montaniterrae]